MIQSLTDCNLRDIECKTIVLVPFRRDKWKMENQGTISPGKHTTVLHCSDFQHSVTSSPALPLRMFPPQPRTIYPICLFNSFLLNRQMFSFLCSSESTALGKQNIKQTKISSQGLLLHTVLHKG